jgi:hypothetical protein
VCFLTCRPSFYKKTTAQPSPLFAQNHSSQNLIIATSSHL